MATVTKWTPFGVALNITATAGTVTRTSATQYTVKINASWESYYSGAKTNYGMTASSGGGSATINKFGTSASSGSGSFTGTYTISGNGSATKTVTVTFKNFNSDNGNSATKTVSFNVTVPAWTSYKVTYNANSGSGAPSAQTKWKDQTLKLSTTKPTRTGYSFSGWGTSASDTTVDYAAGANYTANAAITLYAIWKANTYTVSYNANGGTGAPSNQTKSYGTALTLSTTKPTRTNYNFLGWAKTSTATTATYQSGGSYTDNAAVTLYAVWELAYIKPRINNLTATRYEADGTPNNEGTSAMITFDWECDRTVSSIEISWETETTQSTPLELTVDTTQTSGHVDKLIIDEFSTESTYVISVKVADDNGNFTKSTTLSSTIFPIDILVGGRGIAFGKVAEEEYEGYADSGFTLYARNGIKFPVLPENTDLNDVLVCGTYPLGTQTTYTYVNSPITSATSAVLEVAEAGESGQIMQRITTCTKVNPIVYERFYYSGAWGNWITSYAVLYNNPTGTTGTVTLAETAANFKMLEIIVGYSDIYGSQSVKVYSPNSKVVDLSSAIPGGAPNITVVRTRCTISGTSITQAYNTRNILTSGSSTITSTENILYIKTVIGYR